MSHQTHYRSYRGRVLWVNRPNQQCQSRYTAMVYSDWVADVTDVNECDVYNGRCQHTCINVDGSYYCDCNPGFVLAPNSRTCNGIRHRSRDKLPVSLYILCSRWSPKKGACRKRKWSKTGSLSLLIVMALTNRCIGLSSTVGVQNVGN